MTKCLVNELRKVLDKDSEIDGYVYCSTLNQIVNYMPIKHLGSQGIKVKEIKSVYNQYNIYEGRLGSKSKYDVWNQNLIEVIDDLSIIKSKSIVLSNEDSKKENIDYAVKRDYDSIKKYNVILWNFTGGQRSTVFYLCRLIRERHLKKSDENQFRDIIIYLEGNEGKYHYSVISGLEDITNLIFELGGSYETSDISLKEVVELTGLKADLYPPNLLESFDYGKSDSDRELIKRINENYIIADFDTRKELCESNKIKEEGKSQKKVIEIINRVFADVEINDNDLECLKKRNKNYFGYLLEEMVKTDLLKVIDEDQVLKDNIVGVYHSVKLELKKHKNIVYSATEQNKFCELDFVILTKYGQVIVIECKSGGMSGDTSKAKQYSTYILGSIYGEPILITPLTKTDLINKSIKDLTCYDALKSANRSDLHICYIDSLADDLKEILSSKLKG